MTSKPFYAHLYYLAQNTKPYPVFYENLTNATNFVHADIQTNASGTYLYVEMNEAKYQNGSLLATYKVVNATQVSMAQAVFNNEWNGTFTGELVNNKVRVCPPGCTTC